MKTKNYIKLTDLRIYTIVILVFLMALASCKVKEKMAEKPLIRVKSAQHLVEKLRENEMNSDWLSIKASTDLIQQEKKTSFKAHIRIRQDSIIWMSVSPLLGVEIARLSITPDSVKFLNRTNRSFFVGNFDYLNDLFSTDMDFETLQALILGNSAGLEESTRIKASLDKGDYLISNFRKRKLRRAIKKDKEEKLDDDIAYSFWLNPSSFKIIRIMIHDFITNKKIIATYDDFEDVDGVLFPTSNKFVLHSGEKVELHVNYSRVNTGKKLRTPFKAPDKYERIH